MAAGLSKDDTESIVDHHLIGKRKPRTGREGLYASPEAIAMLHEQPQEKLSPQAPDGWMSANKRRAVFLIGDTAHRNRKLEAFRQSLIDDLTEAGIPLEQAIAVVEHNLPWEEKANSWPGDPSR